MHFTLFLIMFLSSLSVAKEVKTEAFTINLPDELTIQTDKIRRVLAFGKNNNPFISIEFGNGIKEQYFDIVANVNGILARMGSVLSPRKCGDDCEAMYAKGSIINDSSTTYYAYFYIVKSSKQNFIISASSQEPLNSGELEVINIAKQILQSDI